MRTARPALALLAVLLLTVTAYSQEDPKPVKDGEPLPDTKALTLEGDIAAQLVAGVDRFLLKETEAAAKARGTLWTRNTEDLEAFRKSIAPNLKRLGHMLGVRDARVPFSAPELVATVDEPALVGKGANYEVFAVRWPAFGDVHGEGLLLRPTGGKPIANMIAIPDADVTPEQLCGLVPGVEANAQYARRLAEAGCRVLVPVLIDRTYAARNGRAKMTSREYIYRSAFELGRHIIGYEIQKVLAGVDWFAKHKDTPIGVVGWGEGGLLAFYAAALDQRIESIYVSGFFGGRERLWEQPIDRNVFGLVREFGDGEVVAALAGRGLHVELASGPVVTLPSEGGAPGRLTTMTREEREAAKAEFDRGVDLARGGRVQAAFHYSVVATDTVCNQLDDWLKNQLGPNKIFPSKNGAPEHLRKDFDPRPRQLRQLKELDRHNQQVLAESPYVRRDFLLKLADMSQASGNKQVPVAEYEKNARDYRKVFAEDVIGQFNRELLPMNPRSRKAYDAEKWTGYEVVLDVFPDVIAYGILLLPKDLKKDEKRPVVVCQHGLEGQPKDTIGKPGYAYYKAFAAELANRGFITFAPQNLYIGHDKFRTLQRKANPLGKSLFSVIVPQHQQIINWLKTLPNVDGSRIGFYGLSYGGKSAMRIPALVTDYALSICSADFNEWVVKNASTRAPYSYVWTSEYEIFEFDLGSTFNYAEMAALIAPRPFMVERGHFDGVGIDEMVGYEFGKLRFLYEARLKLPGRCEIEWFDGPHTINGKGTYAFLHRHLKWPEPK
jgi:dienelactone hydrolase